MNVKELKSEGLKKEYKVTLPSKNFEEKVNKKLEEVAKKVKIQGFRPGKAPKAMVEKQYRASVVGEVLESLIQDAAAELLKSKKLSPAVLPDVKITKFEDGKDIEMEVSVEVLPEIKVGDFSGIKLDKQVVEVDAAEVDKALKYMSESRRETQKISAKRASKNGDTLIIDFVGSVDGVEFQGGKGGDYPLVLGSNTFIPGFEEQLVGKNVGDKVDVKVKFPENYHAKDLAGKDSVFAVEVKEIREPKVVEINEEFAKSLGEKSLADLKAKVKDRIAADYEKASRMKLKRKLLDALDKEYNFQVPASLLDQEYDAIVKQYQHAKEHNHLDPEDANRSEKDILAEYKDIALRRVKLGLLLSEAAKEAKVVVEANDINNAIMEEARKYPGQEQMVLEYYLKNKDAVEALRAPIYEDKIVDYILGKVKLNNLPVSVEELYNFDDDAPAKKKAPAKKAVEKKEPKAEPKTKAAKK
ncbi:MAG: trigger factor [Lactobacillaceae bacterium]|jgi:trigger factor|nr:trigger factor [Lactobacillaceae bacterium]